MALFTVKTSKKVETSMRLEESTAKMLDRYAHFHQGPADDVVNEALEYIFKRDKDFQQYLQQNPNQEVAASVRIKKVPSSAKPSQPNTNGNGQPSASASRSASPAASSDAK
jgi:hypothetical protein